MAKRNLKKEKAARNEEYAKHFRKESGESKTRPGTYKNWCRTQGHPPTCSCSYPSRAEVIEASRGRR